VGAGLAVATKQFIEFDNSLHKAGAVFSDLDSGADDFQDRLKVLGTEARNVAAATEFNATQAADALAAMPMAGIKSDQAIALLPKTANLATAAGIDLSKAAGMAADSLGVFRMMSDDPTKLAENFEYVSDILAKASSMANMDIGLMFEAASQGGAQFTKANQSIEDFGATIDALASVNIKGSEAGRAVNVMMTRLASPAKAGADALKNLGIQTMDSNGNLLNFIDIIGQFQNKMAGMGTAEAAGYIDAIFGKQYITQEMPLLMLGPTNYASIHRS
jgi:TP901 family phage tail tape measure protein